MHVHLSPKLERFVQNEIESGHYASAGEVFQEALRLLEERDRILALQKSELRKKIAEGAESLQRDGGVDGEQVFARLEAELDALEKGRKAG